MICPKIERHDYTVGLLFDNKKVQVDIPSLFSRTEDAFPLKIWYGWTEGDR
jgi:hypothetical protein